MKGNAPRWTNETETGAILASFATEEAALAAFFNDAVLSRLSDDFQDEYDVYFEEYRLKFRGVELMWH